jgi:hypothetical protein
MSIELPRDNDRPNVAPTKPIEISEAPAAKMEEEGIAEKE